MRDGVAYWSKTDWSTGGQSYRVHSRELETFPGFEHKWWLYIPAQYDGKEPIALMVFQDGSSYAARDESWRVPIVLNNLIVRKELPVMAAVFVVHR
jgi:enterochelin esterase family protein